MRGAIRVFRGWVLLAVAACGRAASSSEPVDDASPPVRELDVHENERITVPPGALAFVRTDRIAAGGPRLVVEAPARVAFRDDALARVGAPVPGRVQAVHVKVGDRVHAGDPLVTLGSPDAAGTRAELRHARTLVRSARIELDRQIALAERGVGLARDRVAAEAAVAQAESELARAQQSNALLGRDRGGVVVVRAPIDGVVLSRGVTRGATAEPGGEPLLELGDPRAVWIAAEVLEHEIDRVREGARATITFSGAIERRDAIVAAVGGAVDTETRRAPVWLELRGDGTPMRAGTWALAEIDVDEAALATIPTSAVVLESGLRAVVYVATATPGEFERRRVVVERPVRGRTPVVEGLSGSEEIVVEGALLLDATAEQLL